MPTTSGSRADGLAEGLVGELDVGCFVTFAPIVLPGLLRVLAERHPGIRVRPHEDDLRALQDGLARGRFGLALTYDLNLAAGVAFESLVALPLYVALPARHPLAGRAKLRLRELAGEPLVLLGLPDSRSYFLSVFAEAGFEPEIACETRSFEMVRGLVANGHGYSLLHSRAPHRRALDGATLACVPLAEPRREIHMGLARLSEVRATRMDRAFAEVCRECLADLLAGKAGGEGRAEDVRAPVRQSAPSTAAR